MRSKKHLFFTGIKHSGKTTFAKAISNEWGYPFFDSDDLILEKLDGKTIREFYKESGKEAFMSLELNAVRDFLSSSYPSFILSLGGGASDNAMLIDLIRDDGYLIYLQRNESDILPMILEHGIPPFLDANDVKGSFHQLYTRRDGIYRECADLIIPLGPYRNKKETQDYIEKKLKENGYGI